MGETRHVPVRMCVGCRKRGPKEELLRLAADDYGQLIFDKKKIISGRGVYVCPRQKCLESAIKRKGFTRGLRRRFREGVPEEVFSALQEEGEWQR